MTASEFRARSRYHSNARLLRASRGLTLTEVVVSTVSTMTLLAGLSSALFIASRAASTRQSSNLATTAGFAMDDLATELRHAKTFLARSATSVTFKVDDRSTDADSTDETIRYTWDKTVGGAITRTYNGVTTAFLKDVYNFSLEYNTQAMPSNKRVLFIQGNVSGAAATYDNFRVQQFQTWGYNVIRKTTVATTTQSDLEAAAACADVVYISTSVTPDDVNTKLKNTTTGTILEEAFLADSFGLSTTDGTQAIEDQIRVSDANFYITSNFPTGAVRIFSSAANLCTVAPNYAPGLTWCCTEKNDPRYPNLAILEAGGLLTDGTTAAGLRVVVPWGAEGVNPALLNADGLTLWKRTLEWSTGNQLLTSVDIVVQTTGVENEKDGGTKSQPVAGATMQTRVEIIGRPKA